VEVNMKSKFRWLGILVALGVSVAGSTGCIEEGPGTPNGESPVDVTDPTDPNNPTNPERPAVPGTAPFVRVSGEAGAELSKDADGLVTAELRVGNVEALRTLGVIARVEGADIVEWERHDEFLKSAGGQIVALESKIEGDELRMVLGTTQVVSSDGENDALLATLKLRPTAGTLRVSVLAEGDHLGAIDAAGSRIELDTFDAAFTGEGN
jgi:hypothetical protein